MNNCNKLCSPKNIGAMVLAVTVGACGGGNNNTASGGGGNNTGSPQAVGEIRVHENNRVSSLLLSQAAYNEFINGRGNSREIAQLIYTQFEDHFDFITLALNENEKPDALPFGSFSPVQQSVRGIRQDNQMFDNSELYGSDGKLLGVMNLPTLDTLFNGPSLHELAHCCANHIFTPGARSSVRGRLGPHWGFTGGSTAGQLGGFRQDSLITPETSGLRSHAYAVDDFNENANGGNSIPYNDLELYLMGFIPLNQVRPFDAFSGISRVIRDTTGPSRNPPKPVRVAFDATTVIRYTPESLLAKLGPRVPSSANSQKEFKMLVVVLTPTALSEQQWNTIDTHSERFGRNSDDGDPRFYSFWEATRGLGRMNTGNINTSLKPQ